MNLHEAYQGKKVFITGHTGFKGAWLKEWLRHLGAEVIGYSLPDDILNFEELYTRINYFKPDFLFHLAAQSLVATGYAQPLKTFSVNSQGTLSVLHAIKINKVPVAVIVTTDKVYLNDGTKYKFRESDPLGGNCPYSSSKAAAECATAAYINSFFKDLDIRCATARAGNVIGGGDSTFGRIVPDCIKAFTSGQPLTLRMPHAVRPWIHVLDVLNGYLTLGAKLASEEAHFHSYNFGPFDPAIDTRNVRQLVEALAAHFPRSEIICEEQQTLKESTVLRLDTERAWCDLNWKPKLTFEKSIELTANWYNTFDDLTLGQIKSYETAA